MKMGATPWWRVEVADRIYTYQQNLIIQYIENLDVLFNMPVRPRRAIKELLMSLSMLAEDEPSVPDRLKPSVYFADKPGLWKGRQMAPDIRTWMVKLHRHLDDSHGRTAAR
jgi:hypothetical protein